MRNPWTAPADPISSTKPSRPPARSAAAQQEQAKDYGDRVVAAEAAVDRDSVARAASQNRNRQPGAQW